jgi:hypothetical protein
MIPALFSILYLLFNKDDSINFIATYQVLRRCLNRRVICIHFMTRKRIAIWTGNQHMVIDKIIGFHLKICKSKPQDPSSITSFSCVVRMSVLLYHWILIMGYFVVVYVVLISHYDMVLNSVDYCQ